MGHFRIWRQFVAVSGFIALIFTTTACQMSQAPFQRKAGDAGATFAAAKATLDFEHQQKITSAYASSSFENFQRSLEGLDQELASQEGAPDPQNLQQLLQMYKAAMEVVKQPCLDENCDWRGQLAILDQTSQALLKAGGQ